MKWAYDKKNNFTKNVLGTFLFILNQFCSHWKCFPGKTGTSLMSDGNVKILVSLNWIFIFIYFFTGVVAWKKNCGWMEG